MKLKTIVLALILSATLFQAKAQDDTVKIGYTNIELILAYLPETKDMEKQLSVIQKRMGEQMKVKETYAQQKLQEYMTGTENGTLVGDAKTKAEEELMKLDEELQKFASDAELEIMSEREEMLAPLLDKLQNTIDEVAEEGDYTYILNQTTSGGVSTILFGPEQNDVTELIMKKLGIEIPEEQLEKEAPNEGGDQ